MRIEATQPLSDAAAQLYRHNGYWQSATTAADHAAALAAGDARTALVDAQSSWTYSQLADCVNTIRARLARAGVTSQEAVLIVAPLRNEAVAAYLAVRLLGAVAVLLDRRCGPSDVVAAVRAARPRTALAFGDDSRRLDLTRHCPVTSLKALSPSDDNPTRAVDDDVLLDPDVPAVVLFTSGTTSTPKGVLHTLNSLRCGTSNMVSALDVGSDDAFFLSSPLAGITGLLQVESALSKHAKVILEEKFSPVPSLDRVYRNHATIVGGAPIIAESLFAHAQSQDRAGLPLRCIAVGGTMIPPAVLDAADRLGVAAVRIYGSTELPFSTATATAAGGGHARDDDGAPLPGVQIAIDEAGGTDELLVRGPHQFHGYLNTADNADAFTDGWVRTGDRAAIDNGRLTITGRLKDVVVCKGMKISLAEIDVAAAELGDCAAFGVPDETTGERLALAIRASDCADITYETVIAHLRAAGLATWKLPEQIVAFDSEFPRTASGKIVRARLAQESAGRPASYAPRLDIGRMQRSP